MHKSLCYVGLAVFMVSAAAGQLIAGEYEFRWQLPDELFKELNHVQRAQIEEAADPFRKAYRGVIAARQKYYRNGRRTDRDNSVNAGSKTGEDLFRVAALEWQKLRVQARDSFSPSVVAYIVFMQAYSEHHAQDRFKAIATYREVIDYYPDEIWIVVPALHFMAMAHDQSGDTLPALQALEKIAVDKDYLLHPLAAASLRRVAENAWNNKEFAKAARYWEMGMSGFKEANPLEAWGARRMLLDYYVLVARDMAGMERVLSAGINPRNKPELCAAIAEQFRYAAIALVGKRHVHDHDGRWQSWYFKKFYTEKRVPKEVADVAKILYAWLKAKEPLFAAAGENWAYRSMMLSFTLQQEMEQNPRTVQLVFEHIRAGLSPDPRNVWSEAVWAVNIFEKYEMQKEHEMLLKDLRKAVDATTLDPEPMVDLYVRMAVLYSGDEKRMMMGRACNAILGATLEPARKETMAAGMITTLCHHGLGKEARRLLPCFADKGTRLWKLHFIVGGPYGVRGDPKENLAVLAQLEALQNPNDLHRIRTYRAEIYKRTGMYREAIAEYRKINKPPGTLHSIKQCYLAMKHMDKAIATLNEIKVICMNKTDEAAAVFEKGEIYKAFGKKDLAIAIYRQVLSAYPKTHHSSLAHQRLEDYGIATGGGQVHGL